MTDLIDDLAAALDAAALRPMPPVHHTLTAHQVDQICRAADLDDWSGGRDDHPLEVSEPPLAALRQHGRLVGAGTCLAVTGLTGTDRDVFLLAFAAVAPVAARDLIDHRLIWRERTDPSVDYLLGVTVAPGPRGDAR